MVCLLKVIGSAIAQMQITANGKSAATIFIAYLLKQPVVQFHDQILCLSH
jgi:hypothetical protein